MKRMRCRGGVYKEGVFLISYGVITPPKEHLLREEQQQLDTIPVTILVKNNPGQK